MDRDERRIRSLKLSGYDDTLFVQARYRLEEAFRTFSLSGLPPNAQLLVRRLDLGRFRVYQSPVILADRLGDLVRQLAVTARRVDFRPTGEADAVWFSDSLQAYKILALRLLDGIGAGEWYWRTLLPNRALSLNEATVELILSQAAATPLKGLACARLLDETLEPKRLARLFSCLTVAMVRRLLQEQGLSVGAQNDAPQTAGSRATALEPIAPPELSSAWLYGIRQAVERWGGRDSRTIWFAWHGLLLHRPAWLQKKEVLQRIIPGDWLTSWKGQRISGPGTRTSAGDRTDGFDQPAAGLAEDDHIPGRQDKIIPLIEAGADSVAELFAAKSDRQIVSPSRQIGAGKAGRILPGGHAGEQPQEIDARTSRLMGPQDGIDAEGGAVPEETLTSLSARDDRVVPASVEQTDEIFRVPYAGFAFVIPLLQRLGMADLLADNERLIALDLPRQLLWSLARRFGLPQSGPLQLLFDGFEPSADVTLKAFGLPGSWRSLVTASGRPLRGVDCSLGRESIRFHGLIVTIQLLLALYLRRSCNISLRTLIQRPGRLLMTTTHWDTIFDLNQLDLNLRRVALDCDPGWVVWLGKVVQFHYDGKGERYV